MAPILRSTVSAPPLSTGSMTSNSSASRTPTRRTPHCTKCGRPRAGHPRSGCPYHRLTQEPEITAAFGSLQLISSVECKTEEVQQSLQPLAPRIRRVVSEPQAVRDEPLNNGNPGTSQRARTRIVQWQQGLENVLDEPQRPQTSAHRSRSVMPGTLLTPNSSVFGSPAGSPSPEDHCATQEVTSEPIPSSSTRPLARTLSQEERNAFLNGLAESAHAPPASAFIIPMDEIYHIQRSAAKVGFHSRVVSGDEEANGWLILGSDNRAVELLFQEVSLSKKTRRRSKSNGKLRAAAGGAVVGAVATFTGLAFS